jgi:hypothetical protein
VNLLSFIFVCHCFLSVLFRYFQHHVGDSVQKRKMREGGEFPPLPPCYPLKRPQTRTVKRSSGTIRTKITSRYRRKPLPEYTVESALSSRAGTVLKR